MSDIRHTSSYDSDRDTPGFIPSISTFLGVTDARSSVAWTCHASDMSLGGRGPRIALQRPCGSESGRLLRRFPLAGSGLRAAAPKTAEKGTVQGTGESERPVHHPVAGREPAVDAAAP